MPKTFKKRSDLEKARASALASLCMREHSFKELSEKLQRKGYEDECIEIVLKECLENNYINDERFAEMYWRFRSAKGFGPMRIESELKQKGISSTTIQASSNQEELNFVEVIEKVYEKKFRGKPIADFKDKLKRQNYLYQRGFDRGLITCVVKD